MDDLCCTLRTARHIQTRGVDGAAHQPFSGAPSRSSAPGACARGEDAVMPVGSSSTRADVAPDVRYGPCTGSEYKSGEDIRGHRAGRRLTSGAVGTSVKIREFACFSRRNMQYVSPCAAVAAGP